MKKIVFILLAFAVGIFALSYMPVQSTAQADKIKKAKNKIPNRYIVAARSAKFSPTLINSPPILVNGIIFYRLKIDGAVETDIVEKNKK